MNSPIDYEAILATRAAETVTDGGGGVKTGLHDRLRARNEIEWHQTPGR